MQVSLYTTIGFALTMLAKKDRKQKPKQGRKHVELDPPTTAPMVSRIFNNRTSLLVSALSSFLPQSPKIPHYDLQSRFKLLDSNGLDLFRKQRRFIARQFFGLQTPEIKLNLVFGSVTINSGIVSLSYAIKFSNIQDYSNWSVLFDEVLPMYGAMYYHSAYCQSLGVGKLIMTGAIDFDNPTVPATASDMMAYDSVKVFDSCPTNTVIVKWPIKFELPDKEYYQLNTSVTWAYLLLMNYNAPTITSTTEVGIVYGKLYLRFRQVE